MNNRINFELMIMPLLKTVIFSCFALGFTGVTLAQTLDEKILNQNIQLRVDKINQETDSLATILAALKINFEKLNSEDAKKIQDFKTTEKYESIIGSQFKIDSILTSCKQQIKFLDVLSDRDNLLDSLLIGRKIRLTGNLGVQGGLKYGSVEITKIKDDISYKNLSSKGFEIESEAPDLIREWIYQGFLDRYKKELIQSEIQFKTFQNEQLFTLNYSFKYSKSSKKLSKSYSGQETFGQFINMIISFNTYSKWRNNGGTASMSNGALKIADEKMKQGDYIAFYFDKNFFLNDPTYIGFYPDGRIGAYGNMGFDFDYSENRLGWRIINEKQHAKIQEKLRDMPSAQVKLYDQAETTIFWENFLKQINLVKRHLAAKDETLALQPEIQSLTEQKKEVDLLVKNLDKSLKDLENKLSGPTKSLKSKIDDITRTVDSKDRRIEKAKEEEKRRLTYIVNGDAYLKNNDFEAAISSYKNAQTIRQSSDLIEKIQLAEKKYAPILAKKQEVERLAKLKREKSAREEAARMEKELPQTAFEHLKDYLKSPYTARMNKYAVNKINRCRTIVTLEVDSQNGFGAYVRSSYNVFFANGRPCYAKEGGLTEVGLFKNNYQGYQDLYEAMLTGVGCGCR